MSERGRKSKTLLKPIPKEEVMEEGNVLFRILASASTPQALRLLEMHHMVRSIYLSSMRSSIGYLKLKYCLFTLLGCIMISSAVLSATFYVILNQPNVGLSFVGTLLTASIGFLIAYLFGRD